MVPFYRASSYASAVLAVVILFIRLSVYPSHAGFVTKPNNALRIFWYHTKGQSLFSDTNSGWWVTPISVWNLRSKWPTPFEKRRLQQISTYNALTVRDSEKVQLWQIRNRPRAFQQAIGGVRTLPLSSRKGGSKGDFLFFVLNGIQFQSNKVCYKVSLCEYFRHQRCSIAIPLSNGILARNVTLPPKI